MQSYRFVAEPAMVSPSVRVAFPLADAIFAATRNPAQSIGIYDEVGSIAPGKKAHVLLVDDELNLKQVIM